MNRLRSFIKSLFFLFVVVSLTAGCASVQRAKIIKKTRTDSCDLSEMGKNRYFHTKHYERKISHSSRKIRHRIR